MKTAVPMDLDPLLKRLNLANTRRSWMHLAQIAEENSWGFPQFLEMLLREEIAHRAQTRIQRLSRHAGFPFIKTIEDFDFSLQSTLRLQLMGSALGPEFVSQGNTLILYGKPGRGKTHLAVAIGYKAILNGFEPLFVTAAEVIDHLAEAFRTARFAACLQRYVAPHLLIIDELGYLACADPAANVLFHVVNERHRRRKAMIFTTNKPLSKWGDVLHDQDLAGAIIDRILERGRVITLDGPSMRTRHLKVHDPACLTPEIEPDRISGIYRTEFPERTYARSEVSLAI